MNNSFGITAATPAGTYTLTVAGTLTNANYNVSATNDGVWTVETDINTNTNISRIIINDEEASRNGDIFTKNISCDANSIRITVETENKQANVFINGERQTGAVTIAMSKYGDSYIPVTVTVNGASKTYTLKVNIPVHQYENFVEMRWNNTLTVINNPNENGGYRFRTYRWYRNGELVGVGQTWTAGTKGEKLNPNDEFRVEMETVDGESLRCCGWQVTLSNSAIKAYPNPVVAGSTFYIETEHELPDNTTLEVYNATGVLMDAMKVRGGIIPVRANYPAGIFTVVLKSGDGFNEKVKIIVNN